MIGELDDPSGSGEEAKFELIARGAEVVPELTDRVGTLQRFGKLTPIEAFEALAARGSAGPGLRDLITQE